MTDFTQVINRFTSEWSGRTVIDIFPDMHLKTYYQWKNIVPGCCLHCKTILTTGERYPAGKSPRCICESCYTEIVAGKVNQYCILSGYKLPDDYIEKQSVKPRAVMWNILPGNHQLYYVLAANKALGEDVSFIAADYGDCVQGDLFTDLGF